MLQAYGTNKVHALFEMCSQSTRIVDLTLRNLFRTKQKAQTWPSLDQDELELPKNRLCFTRGGDTLIVSFDNAGIPHRSPRDRPAWGHKFFMEEGHSVLGVIAYASDWYRDQDLHNELIKLRETGFFASFKRVVFTGSSMGGYAATAFASLAPGSNVISFNPQSTLKADLVPWDKLHPKGSRQDWNGLFYDGAAEAKVAEKCYVLYDPFHFEDRMHAERYEGDGIRLLRTPFLGHGLPDSIKKMGLLKEVMRRGIDGSLDENVFSRLVRVRKDQPKYYRSISKALAQRGRFSDGARLMSFCYEKFQDPFFKHSESLFLACCGDIENAFVLLDDFDLKQRKARRRKRKNKP